MAKMSKKITLASARRKIATSPGVRPNYSLSLADILGPCSKLSTMFLQGATRKAQRENSQKYNFSENWKSFQNASENTSLVL